MVSQWEYIYAEYLLLSEEDQAIFRSILEKQEWEEMKPVEKEIL